MTENLVVSNPQKLLAVYDANGVELSYSIISAPSHGVLSGTGPEFTYTPNNGYVGADEFRFKVNDGIADSNITTISISVLSTNTPPVTLDQTFSLEEDSQLAMTLNALDNENDALTIQILNAPLQGVITGSYPNLIYTPQPDFNGVDSFTYSANDGLADSNQATVSLNISPVNDAPIVNDSAVTTDEDSALNIILSANDIDGDSLTYQVVVQPTQGALAGTAPNLVYTPNADFNGSDSFSYQANDVPVASPIATV